MLPLLTPLYNRLEPRLFGLPFFYWCQLAFVPLVTPLYNRIEPRLFGLPFFYWCRLAFVLLDVAVIGLVYKLTKRRM